MTAKASKNSFKTSLFLQNGFKPLKKITGRLETVYQSSAIAKKALETASRKPFEVASALMLTAVGAVDIVRNGDLFSGLTTAGIGAAQLYKIYCDDGGKGKLAELLKSASLDVELIRTFQEENKSSIASIKENVETVDKAIAEMGQILNDLESSFEDVSQKTSSLQKELAQSCHESLKLLTAAKKQFEEAFELAVALEDGLEKAVVHLNGIQQLARSADDHFKNKRTDAAISDLKNLQVLSEAAISDFTTSNRFVLEVRSKLDAGCKTLLEVSENQHRLMVESGKVIKSLQAQIKESKKGLKAIGEKLKICESANSKSKKAIKKLEENNALVDRVLDELSKELQDAQSIARYTATFDEILIGGGAGSLVVATVGASAAITVTAPLAGVIAYKYRDAFKNCLRWAFGIDKSEPKLEASAAKPVEIAFDNKSSGLWNHYVKKKASSTTVGSIQVRLPNGELFNTRFDLNQKGDKMQKSDIFNLVFKLKECLKQNPKSAKQCLDIIGSLRTHVFKRSKEDGGDVNGALLQNNVLINYFEKLCNTQMKLLKGAKQHL